MRHNWIMLTFLCPVDTPPFIFMFLMSQTALIKTALWRCCSEDTGGCVFKCQAYKGMTVESKACPQNLKEQGFRRYVCGSAVMSHSVTHKWRKPKAKPATSSHITKITDRFWSPVYTKNKHVEFDLSCRWLTRGAFNEVKSTGPLWGFTTCRSCIFYFLICRWL